MFPLSAEKEGKKGSEKVFANAFAIVLIGVIIALLIFYLFPEIIIKIFSGREIPESIFLLFYVGIAFGLISIANLILLYKLSLKKTKGFWYLAFFIVLEIFLLSYFSDNLMQFSIAFITSSAAFLWGVIVLMKE